MRLSAILTTLVGLAVAGGSAYYARDYVERSKQTVADSERATVNGHGTRCRPVSTRNWMNFFLSGASRPAARCARSRRAN